MRHFKRHNLSFTGLSEQFCTGLIIVFVSTLLTTVFFFGNPAHGAMDLSDEPLMTGIKPAPANIMILLDDSASMSFEVLAAHYYEGRFPNPSEDEQEGYCYIFDDAGGNAFQDALGYMGPTGRILWKSQSHEYNVMYYNPEITYS